ncbi:MAG: ACT domain-containing protein, partial [Candidatus Binatia bacterium]
LFLLTRADSLATGPEAWSGFRSMLVRELYTRTMQQLEGRPEAGASPPPRELALLSEPLGTDEVRTSVIGSDEAHEYVVVARDRPGLLATVCGVLALRGIDVHDAEIYTRTDGVAVEIFRVMGSHGEIPVDRWGRVEADIRSALNGNLDLDEALGRKAAQDRRRRAARSVTRGRVVVDNRASDTHTVVELHTEDRVGLLRDVTHALYAAGCDLSLAKVATYGAEVVDAFYVRNLAGERITDPEHLERIERSLERLFGQSER